MAKITKVTAEDGSISYTEAETSLMDDVIDAAVAPIALVSDDGSEFVSKRTAAISGAGFGVLGYVAGERKGHKRAADGKNPLVGGAIVVN